MDKLVDLLKYLLEKYLFHTIISIIVAILAFLKAPENNWIIIKGGKFTFFILVFCICFLCVQLIIKISKLVTDFFKDIKNLDYERKKKEYDNIQHINEFYDKLSLNDKEILLSFIKNKNKILINFEGAYRGDGLLKNTNIINVSEYRGDILGADKSIYWITNDLEETLKLGMRPVGELKQYRLKEEYFKVFEYVYKLNGKLGNF
ncbi:hypothetical protein GNF80_06535 [Clostridium perfringens]|nr:hypothetical protein [Clostridium perfringens]